MKKILSLFAVIIAVFTAVLAISACNTRGEEIIIGYTLYAPMNYKDDDGKLIGFDTEFAEKVCADLGYTPKFQIIDWDSKVTELETGNIDLIWNGMTITDELKENIAISDPYMENKQVAVVRAADASKYTDAESLGAAASAAVESGSAGQSTVETYGYLFEVNKMTAQSDCLLEVKAGRSDIAIIDITMARAMTGEGTSYSDLTYIDVGFEGEEYGIGMRKEDIELLEKINGKIAQYKADGTLDALIAKYML